jgi:ketosteroid isomerase-like protein
MGANAELLTRLFAAFAADDMETIDAALAPGVRLHTPGTGVLAGTVHGRAAVLAHLRRSHELTDGTYRTEVEDVLDGEHHAAALYRATGERLGRSLDIRMLALYAIEDGAVSEIWFTPLAHSAFEAFWA